MTLTHLRRWLFFCVVMVFKSLERLLQGLDGTIHVICGVLVAYLLNFVRWVTLCLHIFRYTTLFISPCLHQRFSGLNLAGRGAFPNAWKLGTFGHDGKGPRTFTTSYGAQSRVRTIISSYLQHQIPAENNLNCHFLYQNQNGSCSRRSEKYFRRGAKLDWPEGATSRDSLKAVWKLPRLPVNNLTLDLTSAYLKYWN